MKKKIQQTIRLKYSIGNYDLVDFLPVAFTVVVAYFLPLTFGYKAGLVYIGWEMTSVIVGIKKFFPRSFMSYAKYRLRLTQPNTMPPQKIKEFAG